MKRSRDMKTVNTKHNLDFSIKSNMEFQNPIQNVKVLLMQNGHWASAIYNVKPQYTIGTELIYKYNQETQFWAGNEFRFWDNKDLRAASNTVNRVQLQNIYHSHLYTAQPRGNFPYTFYPDANGTFIPRNINSVQPSIEADYAWVFVYLDAPSFFEKKEPKKLHLMSGSFLFFSKNFFHSELYTNEIFWIPQENYIFSIYHLDLFFF